MSPQMMLLPIAQQCPSGDLLFPVRGCQICSLPILYLIYFIFATNLVPMSLKSNKNAQRPRIVPTLEIKLQIAANYEAVK
jgi:hypothetical protein